MRIIVTRPSEQARDWVEPLRAQLTGTPSVADVIALPLIDIIAPSHLEPVEHAWRTLSSYRLIVFVSPSAAQWFFALRPTDAAPLWPAGAQAAAPGPGTGAVLIRLGVPPDQVLAPDANAPQFDSETLWARLGGIDHDWHGARALMVCGGDDEQARGRPWLSQQLQARGARVDTLVTYQRRAPQFNPTEQAHLERALRASAQHIWLFSSSEAIGHLIEVQRTQGWPAPGPASIALATHPRIEQTARAAGFGHVEPTRPALPDVVAALQHLLTTPLGAGPIDTIVSP